MSPESDVKVINCSHCNSPLNVTGLSPYTLVECTNCKGFTRTFSQLGNYSITSRLGIGGMSLVFRAEDRTLGREIALKVLNQTYSSQPERVKKFEHEARVMALVSHPNVVKIYAVGESEGLFYIAMELVEGSNLEARIQEAGIVPEREALAIAIEIAEGLRAGYEAGVLHRDMKPANVLFNKKGEAQIVDFGLALLSGDESTEEEIWATPHYAPPEVLERKPEDLRSDIYALGATLYHVFSGKPPITSDTQSITELLELKRNITPLGEKMSGLSEETCLIVDKAMSFAPEERFTSYEELLEALKHAALSLDKGVARTWNQVKRLRQRDKYRTILLLSGGGVIAIGLLLAVLLPDKSTPMNDNQGDTPVVDNTPDPSVSTEEQIRLAQRKAGEQYMMARESFAKGDYQQAGELYREVFLNPNVIEVTGIWAALGGYMSFLLDGNEEQAEDILNNAIARIDQNESSGGDADKLRALAARLSESNGLVKEECETFKSDFPQVFFLGALRAWSKNDFVLAEDLFRQVGDVETAESDWDKQIARQAQLSLADLRALDNVNWITVCSSKDASDKIRAYRNLDRLKSAYARHYASRESARLEEKFLNLKKEEEEFSAKTWNRRETPEWKEGISLLEGGEFDKAHHYYAKLAQEGMHENREIYSVLAELCLAADQFIETVGTYIVGTGKEQKVKGLHGEDLIIKTTKFGQPVFANGQDERKGAWKEIAPESLLALFKESSPFTKSMEADAKTLLDEQALSFAYLTGLKPEVGRYSKSLSGQDGDFAQSWSSKRQLLRVMGL